MEREESTYLTHTILQIYGHEDSMVLAQKQKSRSMEQNRKPRDKSTHLWTSYLQQKIYFLSQTHQLSSEMSPLIAQQCEPLCALKPSLFALLRAAVVGDGGVWISRGTINGSPLLTGSRKS